VIRHPDPHIARRQLAAGNARRAAVIGVPLAVALTVVALVAGGGRLEWSNDDPWGTPTTGHMLEAAHGEGGQR